MGFLVILTGTTIRTTLILGRVPLLVTNTLFWSNEDVPHWVAVTGIDDTWMYFNNPLDAKPRKRKIGLSDLQKFIGYQGDQSMVEVWK